MVFSAHIEHQSVVVFVLHSSLLRPTTVTLEEISSTLPPAGPSLMSERTHATKPFRYERSSVLFERASKVIPNGIYGHFNPVMQVPDGTYPFYVKSAEGSRFRDVDGNEFVDYTCAYGPIVLGYGNPVVDAAYAQQLARSDAATLASPVMVDLAEHLVDLIPVADWALFAKNGSDVTSLAVMIARAATGRSKVVTIEGGYHGTVPWMQPPERAGILPDDRRHVIEIPWNDVAALENALSEHEDVAAFIASPYHHPTYQDNALPDEGYWHRVQSLLRKRDVVFISDDVRCGFRIDMSGSHEYFGYKPDMACYCKAIANGYPLSTLVGSDALREAASDVFCTGSFWFSAAPMAAALACLREMRRISAPEVILEKGRKLTEGMIEIAKSHGHTMHVTGMPSMPYVRVLHEAGIKFHRALCGECTRRGAFFTSHHNWFLSAAHTDNDIQRTWDILDDAFRAVVI